MKRGSLAHLKPKSAKVEAYKALDWVPAGIEPLEVGTLSFPWMIAVGRGKHVAGFNNIPFNATGGMLYNVSGRALAALSFLDRHINYVSIVNV